MQEKQTDYSSVHVVVSERPPYVEEILKSVNTNFTPTSRTLVLRFIKSDAKTTSIRSFRTKQSTSGIRMSVLPNQVNGLLNTTTTTCQNTNVTNEDLSFRTFRTKSLSIVTKNLITRSPFGNRLVII